MKIQSKFFFPFLLCFAILSACGNDETVGPITDPYGLDDGILKILFIGNSHTYYNDLPATVKKTILSSGYPDSVLVVVSAPGGFAFKDHVESTQTQSSVQAENWDWVVLQENGGYASFPPEKAQTEVYPFAAQLRDMVKANNKGTKILLYMTHGYRDGASWCDQDPAVCSYGQMQNEIRRNYIFMGNSLDAGIAPAGMMWKIILSQKELGLWDADTVHPSPTGSYISALTLFAVMQDQRLSSALFVPAFLAADDRELIFDVVNGSVFDGDPDWRVF